MRAVKRPCSSITSRHQPRNAYTTHDFRGQGLGQAVCCRVSHWLGRTGAKKYKLSGRPAGLHHSALQKRRAVRSSPPVTAEWAEWIGVLLGYCTTIRAQSGHAVSRVAISSGQWLVVFTDPETIFLRPGEVPAGSIHVFLGDQLIEASDEISICWPDSTSSTTCRPLFRHSVCPHLHPQPTYRMYSAQYGSRVTHKALISTSVRNSLFILL